MPNPQNPVFPNGVAQDLDLMVATNRALSKLTNPIDAVQTQITVIDGTKFQVPCLVQIDTEIIRVGDISGNNLISCTRGFSQTSTASHGQNADVKGYVLSYHHNQIAAEIKAIEAGLGANFGNVVMQNDQAGGQDIGGVFSNLYLKPNGVTAGTYGGFNTDTIISVDQTGRVTSIHDDPGNINYPIMYKAALVQGTNAVLGFSFANVNAPNPIVYDPTGAGNGTGSGLFYAVAQFISGNDYWVQDHFYLPDDWQGDQISLDIYWRWNPTTLIPYDATANVSWGIRLGGLRSTFDSAGHNIPNSGNGPNVSWGPFKWVTDTVQTAAFVTSKTRIKNLQVGGLVPGDELFFQFARGSSGGSTVFGVDTPGDTGIGNAELISIKFNLNRDFALVQ